MKNIKFKNQDVYVDGSFIGTSPSSFSFDCDWIISGKLSKQEKLNPINIEKVIFNPPATIIIFKDGTKEVFKCADGDEYSPEIGFAQAMMNIMFSSRSAFKKFIETHSKE